ncbi:MAG: DUF2333 family protein [Alphaproteobacteria bacterium]|nr:DUF2333 family protein [Alphaproteobacteria bacterium]
MNLSSELFPRFAALLDAAKAKLLRPEKFMELGALTLIILIAVYIAIGEFSGTVNNTDLNVTAPPGGSLIIEKMARGIERELKSSGWAPSGSPFLPYHIRFDITGFQEGVQQVMIKLAQQANNHFTREGASSGVNVHISAALNNLNRDNVWSIFPANSTADQYRKAVAHLDAFNKNLSEGKASFDPRIDTLSALTSDLAGVIGDEYTRLNQTANTADIFSLTAREQFYHNLGVLAATCWAFQGMRADYDSVIKLQATPQVFDQAEKSACATLNVNPAVVLNGSGYGWAGSNLRTLLGDEAKLLNDLSTFQSSLAAGSGARAHP